jgi:gamma-glutamylcyclotransferase (GGCT)/AIG2-like uncharacterized protein YtfP
MSSVAGSLGARERERLYREGRCLGAASTAGRLYDLGRYPGLVLSDDPTDVVHGEVFALTDPHRVFQWLDPYESIDAQDVDASEYVRVERPVVLASGLSTVAWVYVYRRDVSDARVIATGRWRVV